MPAEDLRLGRPNELYFNDMLAQAMEEVTPGTWAFRTSTSGTTTSFPNSGNLVNDLYFNDLLAQVMEEVSPGVWALRTSGGGGGGVGTLQQVLDTGNIAQDNILLKHPTDIGRTRVNITTDATRGVVAAHGGNNGSALPDAAYAALRDASLEINLDGTTKGILSTEPLTAERNYTLPDNDGMVALISDLPAAQTIQNVLTTGNVISAGTAIEFQDASANARLSSDGSSTETSDFNVFMPSFPGKLALESMIPVQSAWTTIGVVSPWTANNAVQYSTVTFFGGFKMVFMKGEISRPAAIGDPNASLPFVFPDKPQLDVMINTIAVPGLLFLATIRASDGQVVMNINDSQVVTSFRVGSFRVYLA